MALGHGGLTLGYPYEEDDPTQGAGLEAPWRATARWDRVDEEATRRIHEFTTDAAYLTPLVSYVPEDDAVPSPRDVLGYVVGSEGKLTRPRDTARYFEALAAASPHVALLEMGKSAEGRVMHLVVVADAETLGRLEEYKRYTAALADPRETDETRALEIIREAKPITHITAGLHSPETGPPEMVMELAYRLAVSNHPKIAEIRKNVITLITPLLEVDGRSRQVDWYYRFLTEYDNRLNMPSVSPPYWGKYVFHDNNRDGIQQTQPLTVNYVKTFFEWHPTYSLDLHESVPLLYVSSGTGPYNRALDPIVTSEWHWISSWEVTELNRQGLPGVWTWGFYTGWNPTYLLWVTNNHNSLGRFYETFGNSTARTVERDLSEAEYAGKKITSQQWYRANPPPGKLPWSLRNNTNYMQSGVLASLTLVARNGPTLLHNFWKKGRNSLERGRTEAPHAWVIPADQRDRGRLAYLIHQLGRQGIEVHRATQDFEIGDAQYAAGDFVVRLDQPYGNLARGLLSIQKFPKDADQRAYDDVAWTLGLHYRVDTRRIDDQAIFDVKGLVRVPQPIDLAGEVSGRKGAAFYAVKNLGQNALITARYRLAEDEVLASKTEFEADGELYPRGSWLVPASEGLRGRLERLADELGLDFRALRERPDVETHDLDLPRLALYHNWVRTQDDGWVRYTLEQAGVPYTYINDDAIRAGGLHDRFDVILMAHQGRASVKALVHGRDPKFGSMPYTQVPEFPSHGVIDSSPDITGGIGFLGLASLEKFLDQGGTLLLMGSAGRLAADTGLVRNVGTLTGGEVSTAGSVLRTKVVRRDHPIAYGYEDVNHVFRVNGPLYTVPKQYEHWIVVQYGTEERKEEDESESRPDDSSADADTELLLSGYVSGEKELQRKGVVLDVPRQAGGRVLLYSFNPLHRYLNHGDHNYVYNAILHWNDFPPPEPKDHPGLALD